MRSATRIVPAFAAAVLALLDPSSSALAVTRCEAVADAQSWADKQIPYSWGPGASYCPGSYFCDPLRGGKCFRSDCSGLVSAAWDLAGPGHTTYSFAGGPWDDGASHLIGAGELQPGDALNWGGNPAQGTGHVMLYISGDYNSGWVEVIEEYSCGHVATHHWRSIDTSLFKPIRLNAMQPCQSCQSHCEGSVIVGTDCGRADCGAYGSNCVQDAQGARCVFFACPAQGELDVCWMDTHIGHCSNGALASQGDCGAFAAYCSTSGGQAAHCASAFCVASPADVPVPHDVCLPDGQLYSCDGAGGITKLGCGAATRCVSTPSAHCVPTGCPPGGDVHVCQTDTVVAHCVNGQVTDTGDCGMFAAMCSTAGGVDAHCVSDFCVPSAQDVPVAHDICFLDGDRYHCDGAGGIAKIACPAGEKCSTYPSVHCTASTGCPANVNDVWICADGHTRGHCYGGGLGGAEPCPAQTTCVTVSGEGRCVPDACASVPGQSKDLCLPDGKLGHCSPDGTLSSEACAADTSCLDGACVGLDAGAPESDASEPAVTPDATSAIKGDAGVKPGADGGQIALPVAGCGCGAAGGFGAAPWLLVALTAFARRRRCGS